MPRKEYVHRALRTARKLERSEAQLTESEMERVYGATEQPKLAPKPKGPLPVRSTRGSIQHRLNALYQHRARAHEKGDMDAYEQLDARIRVVHAELTALDDTVGEQLTENAWRQIIHRGRKG